MAIELFELAGAQDRRFSPYCWRARMALAHTRLEAAYIPVGFTEKEIIAFGGQTLVPVLRDGETVVSDSWDIACFLEDAHPDRPSLFGGPGRQTRGGGADFGTAAASHCAILSPAWPKNRTYWWSMTIPVCANCCAGI